MRRLVHGVAVDDAASGHDMDHYADGLAVLTEALDLREAIHVGHSTGGGEVARYISRHGSKRVAKAVLISAVPRRSGRAHRNLERAHREDHQERHAEGLRRAPARHVRQARRPHQRRPSCGFKS